MAITNKDIAIERLYKECKTGKYKKVCLIYRCFSKFEPYVQYLRYDINDDRAYQCVGDLELSTWSKDQCRDFIESGPKYRIDQIVLTTIDGREFRFII